MSQILREKKAHAIVTPVQSYIQEKQKFFEAHREIKVLEEVKTLMMGMIEVPDPQLIGKTKQQQALMMAWFILYEEKVKVDSNGVQTH